eukprot:TRINITY_DN1015_c0_g1_i4.p1 TRINITY_DN1015_c0_g1~~TRINITY_DN1015_c0_g1_i4.p1  ORF type:complete len:321 (+),score=97.80 TRINITY_DN1015_c0_g1_i4:139-1101(+)
MKLYTDPNYFLNLWIEGENKDYEQRKKRQRDRREKRKRREGSKGVSGPTRKVHTGLDKEFQDEHTKKQATPSTSSLPIQEEIPADIIEVSNFQEFEPPTNNSPVPQTHSHTPPAVAPPHHPTSAPPSTPNVAKLSQNDPTLSVTSHSHPKRSAPAAPAPAPPSSLPPQPPSNTYPSHTSVYTQPPPPEIPREPSPPPANIPAPPPNMPNVVVDDFPPPPPPPSDTTMDARPSMLGEMGAARGMLRTVERNKSVDARDGLLSAIKMGTTLRKVERREEPPQTQSHGGNDVASILARRIAIEVSDSDSEYDDDYSDDDDWES